jgi:hypothetical protein
MRTTLAIVLGAIGIAAAGAASAQYPDYRNDRNWDAYHNDWRYRDDDRWRNRDWRDDHRWRGEWECWNPHAGHFEEVREGEVQDDLDFSRCRPKGGSLQPYPGRGYYGGWGGWR